MSNHKIKVIAVEDGPFQAEVLKGKLLDGGYEVMGPYNNGEEAIQSIEQSIESSERQPGVAILDIQISGQLDGIDTAKLLYNKYKTGIIFLSQLVDEATRKRIGEIPAIFHSKSDNLINNIALFDAIDRMAREGDRPGISSPYTADGLVVVNSRHITSIIKVEEIVCVEANHEVAYVVLKSTNDQIERHMAKGTLKEVERILSKYRDFVRVSKGCLVNLRRIARINKNFLEEGRKREVTEFKENYEPVKIGRQYKQNLKALLDEL